MLRWITLTRSWHLLVRIGIATIAVAAATALQLPVEIEVPGEPFLLNFIVVVVSAVVFGRTPGFVTVAETTLASLLYFEPFYSFKLTHAVHLLAIEAYAVVAAASVEAFCRLVDSALTEKSEANSARIRHEETQQRLSAVEFMANSLAESEARFRATFENAAVGMSHFTPEGRWFRVNEAMCRILGWPADELITKSFQDITHPDDLAVELAQIEQMRAGRIGSYVVDKRSLRKDGTTVWIRRTVSSVRKNDGSVDYFVSVVEDISDRKHAEEELRKSEERFRSSLIHSSLPIALFDNREDVLALSQSWAEASGYLREELRCIEDWTSRVHGKHSDEVLGKIRRVISLEFEAHASERMIRTKDGRERLWSFVSSTLGSQSNGRRLFVCIAQDVTERKAHEEQVQFLMREVNHRAKNMLSLVQAIARQTAAREPEDFIERFTERVRALAANQDLLVRNAWQGVDVEDLVRAQLAHFADLVGSRIAVLGPKLRLNAVAAQAIGLALHELATNAGKYGAMSVDAGRVDVCWRLEGDTFVMGWTERNGPPVSPPDRRGFGSTVVDSMAKRTLDGEVQLNYAPSGLVWRLTCPAANALEQIGHHEQISRPTENCKVAVVPFPGGRGNSHQWPKGCDI